MLGRHENGTGGVVIESIIQNGPFYFRTNYLRCHDSHGSLNP